MAQGSTAEVPAPLGTRTAGTHTAGTHTAGTGTAVRADAGPDDVAQVDAARLRLAIGRLSRRLRRHQLAGLTPGQVAALATVDTSGPLRLSDLAAIEGIAPSTLTRLVAALEERGYVQRSTVAGDARASELAITTAGRDVLNRIRRESTIALAGALAALDPGQLAALAGALPAIEQLADVLATDDRAR